MNNIPDIFQHVISLEKNPVKCDLGLATFPQALQQLKQWLRQEKRQRYWFWLIGPNGSGKSSWLHQTLQSAQIIAQQDHTARICITEDSVIFDTPGSYLEKEERTGLSQWLEMIKDANRDVFHAAIYMIDVAQLVELTKDELLITLQNLRQSLKRLYLITRKKIPIYLMLSHTDRIRGFNEFFADLSEKEREQIWGVDFNAHTDKSVSGMEFFNQSYSELIESLQRVILDKLHRERHPQKRSLIKDFPLQLESLRSPLHTFVQQAFFPVFKSRLKKTLASLPYELRGIYFCSLKQDGKVIDRLQKPIQQILEFPLEPTEATPAPTTQKIYFAKYLLPYFLSAWRKQRWLKHQHWIKWHPWLRRASYTLAGVIALSGTGLLAHYYRVQMDHFTTAETALQQYQFLLQQLDNNQQLQTEQLAAFDALQKATEALNKVHGPIKKLANETRDRALQTELLPLISNYIEQKVRSLSDTPSSELYRWLRAYLMLGNLRYQKADYVEALLQNDKLSGVSLTAAEKKQFQYYFGAALRAQKIPLPLNSEVISQARKILSSLPYPLLIYLTLKSELDDVHQRIHLISKATTQKVGYPKAQQNQPSLFSENSYDITIPNLYTRAEFGKIYQDVIPKMSKDIVEGDWVLGHAVSKQKVNEKEILAEVRNFYVADYINWWSLSLIKTQMSHFDTLPELNNALLQMTQSDSPIFNTLSVIHQNTAPFTATTPENAVFNAEISNKFSALNQLITPKLSDNAQIKEMQKTLGELQKFIEPLISAKNSENAIFDAAKQLANDPSRSAIISNLLKQAEQAPAPLKTWIQNLGQNALELIFDHAGNMIEQAWADDVYANYQRYIENRYPLVKEAQQEISLVHFTEFFGPNGTLESFFNRYLQPFIDTSSAEWKPKSVLGVSFPVSASTLQQFERAHVIKQMFFADNSPNIEMSFTLQPLTFEPIVRKMSLTINGQLLEDKQGENTISNFNWPGSQKPPLVQLEFNAVDGQYTSITTDGDWALFRLLDHSNLQTTDDSRTYHVLFDLNGNAAKYQLTAHDNINPFMKQIVDHFRAPKTIFGSDEPVEVTTTAAPPAPQSVQTTTAPMVSSTHNTTAAASTNAPTPALIQPNNAPKS